MTEAKEIPCIHIIIKKEEGKLYIKLYMKLLVNVYMTFSLEKDNTINNNR